MDDPLQLRRATAQDVAEMMPWFTDLEQIRTWAGPKFRFPFDAQSFEEDIVWRTLDSWVLVRGPGSGVLAFGQIYEKFNRIHLARLVVSPLQRNQGLGGALIRRLMSRGLEVYGHREYSLYVADHNVAAMACYRREGFVEAPAPESGPLFEGVLFMVRPQAKEESAVEAQEEDAEVADRG